METKYVKVPFEVELAKSIQNGNVEGKIITDDGRNVRIVCFDRKSVNDKFPILALIETEQGEFSHFFNSKGYDNFDGLETKFDLYIEIPEYMTFKDGDVYKTKDGDIAIYNCNYKPILGNISYYVGLRSSDKTLCFHEDGNDMFGFGIEKECTCNVLEEEKQQLIDALKESKDPRAKDCLKKLGIEVKQECEFKLFDRVLVRDDEEDDWKIAEYSHKTEDNQYYVVGGLYWLRCIPYNEKTSHLLGTTEDYKEE